MFKILSQPYPYPQQTVYQKIMRCVLEGVFIAVFLIVFQPFGTDNWHASNKTLVLWCFGFITTAAGFIVRVVLPYFFKHIFVEQNWTIGREVVSIFFLLLLITIGNAFLSGITFGIRLQANDFFLMLLYVILLGFFPISIGILINYIYKLKKYSQPVVVQQNPISAVTALNKIKLIAENEKDTLEINSEDLCFIESSDNYSTIHFLKNNTLQKELLRSSLSRLETQIESPKIVRCHRSYIVNMDKVARVSGNAQGYKFHLNPVELTVPVARKYSELVELLR